jgi:hypothetical protein
MIIGKQSDAIPECFLTTIPIDESQEEEFEGRNFVGIAEIDCRAATQYFPNVDN